MEMPPLVFYQKISELFYSIAATHRAIGEEEYHMLKELISENWKNWDPEEYPFHNYALEKIQVVFDWFDYEELDANECFDSFADYAKDNPELFTEEREKFIWETSNLIANSFAQKNVSERKILDKLRKLLITDFP